MGYYVNTLDVDFTIKAKNLDAAYSELCKLNQYNEWKGGGRVPREDKDGPHDGVWFSWMPWNYDEIFDNAADIFSELGFEVDLDESGDLHLLHYSNKIGQEAFFLEAVAPYVEEGSYVEWCGEDNTMWRHWFTDGIMIVQSAEIHWV